jgi:hypothetical protein
MMQGIITRKPSHFEAGRPLSPVAVNTVIACLPEVIKRLAAGEYSYEEAITRI